MFRPIPARASTPCPPQVQESVGQPRGNQVAPRQAQSAARRSQNSVQSLDAKISGTSPAPAAGAANPTGSSLAPAVPAARRPPPTRSIPTASATSPAANTILLAPNSRLPQVLRRHRPRFQRPVLSRRDLLQAEQYGEAVTAYDKVLPAIQKVSSSDQRASGRAWPSSNSARKRRYRELREVVKHFPGSDEDRLARAKTQGTRRRHHRHPLTPHLAKPVMLSVAKHPNLNACATPE